MDRQIKALTCCMAKSIVIISSGDSPSLPSPKAQGVQQNQHMFTESVKGYWLAGVCYEQAVAAPMNIQRMSLPLFRGAWRGVPMNFDALSIIPRKAPMLIHPASARFQHPYASMPKM